MITNAVYFKGPWATPFDATFTVKSDFRLLDDAGRVQVDMMHNPSLQASHISFNTHSMLALPFKDRSIAMLILLPHENTTAALQRVRLQRRERICIADGAQHTSWCSYGRPRSSWASTRPIVSYRMVR